MPKTAMIIGLGGHARGSWLKAVRAHPDWELAGVVDTDTELLENVPELCPELDEEQAYISIDDAIRYGEGKPDLAIVATPIYTHHVLVKETMDHDLNVICEKNMASTIYQGRQMVQLALDHPELCTAVGTQYRYFPRNWIAHQFFHQPVAENPIGELAYLRWASAWVWGEQRRGWRRWLQEVYLEDMATHWFDLLRYITGLDVVQVRADAFIPKYSEWQGSASVFANLALAHPDDYHHRHNWVWCQFYGNWQPRGPNVEQFQFYGEKGEATLGGSWIELKRYKDEFGRQWEEDGYLFEDAGSIEGLDTNLTGQGIILEMMKRGIDSRGARQPGTHFAEAFKSFAISQGAIESSRTGKAIWIPKYWKDMPI